SFLAFSIGLAVFIVGCLQLIRSDDVLCCFIAGHSFTWDDWFREETKDAHFQEVLDGLINVTFFIYFGAIIPWYQFSNAELVIAPWRLIVAAIMVLFLRRLPVVVLLTRITPAFRNYKQSIFAGWFGPIGVGAIFFAEIVLEEIENDPDNYHIRSREIIQPIVMFLIFTSVLVHGITVPLMYIGKVVRTRSRSFSTMSIRNMVPSRLSFVSSREPAAGIHGVQLPLAADNRSFVSEDGAGPHEKRSSRLFFTGESPTGDHNSSPSDGDSGTRRESSNGKQQDGSLDLTRTITIDETPKIARDQMDIHYRINQTHEQYKQHVQSMQFPTALSGPGYSHLQQQPGEGGEAAGGAVELERPHSAQEIGMPQRKQEIGMPQRKEEIGWPQRKQEIGWPQRKQRRYTVNAKPVQGGEEKEAMARGKKRHSVTGSPEAISGPQALASEEEEAEAEATPAEDDKGSGLVLAADELIASRAATRQSIVSNIEVPESVYTRPDDVAMAHHPSLPDIVHTTPSIHAAHHRGANPTALRRRLRRRHRQGNRDSAPANMMN
ncbi:Na+/H+ antiporter, partial [Coemansia sp. RSA 2559]